MTSYSSSTWVAVALAIALMILIVKITRQQFMVWSTDYCNLVKELPQRSTWETMKAQYKQAWRDIKWGLTDVFNGLRSILFWIALPFMLLGFLILVPFMCIYHAFFK